VRLSPALRKAVPDADESRTLMIGLTVKGRATVEALRTNREGLVNLRRILHAMGEHPPIEPEE